MSRMGTRETTEEDREFLEIKELVSASEYYVRKEGDTVNPISMGNVTISAAKAPDMEGDYVVKALMELKDSINAYIDIKSVNGQITADSLWFERNGDGRIEQIYMSLSKRTKFMYGSEDEE